MTQIQDVKPAAAEYLQAIDPKTWATAYFLASKFGHLTSNIAESTNCQEYSHTLDTAAILARTDLVAAANAQ
ncbi:MAG: hypothetical protein M1829_001984, partial [Trizodia sp. TS-e1964]